MQPVPNGGDGIVIGGEAQSNTIGGAAPGAGNLISGNIGNGIQLQQVGTSVNQVLGNYIGTDRTGQVRLPNDDGVVLILGASNNIVGGVAPGAGNLVSGNNKSGVQLENADTTGNQIIGNRIGLGVSDATPLGNSLDGVKFQDGASTNTIGTGNLIAHNGYAGVLLLGAATRKNRITGNAIIATPRLGIDLGYDGVTPNDAGDSDAGPNDLQNFPLLTGAFATATGTLIRAPWAAQPQRPSPWSSSRAQAATALATGRVLRFSVRER